MRLQTVTDLREVFIGNCLMNLLKISDTGMILFSTAAFFSRHRKQCMQDLIHSCHGSNFCHQHLILGIFVKYIQNITDASAALDDTIGRTIFLNIFSYLICHLLCITIAQCISCSYHLIRKCNLLDFTDIFFRDINDSRTHIIFKFN